MRINLRRLGWLAPTLLLSALAFVAMGLVLSAADAEQAAADTAMVHVDGDLGEDSEICGTVVSPCRTIHYAIASRVDAGGVVSVAAGTYVEQVVITRALTLRGTGEETVIQSPDVLTASFSSGADDNYPIVYVNDTDDVIIEDLVVDGASKGHNNDRFVGVGYHNAGGTVEAVEIKDVHESSLSAVGRAMGLYAYNQDGVSRHITVSNCEIHGFEKNGLALQAESATPLTLDVRQNRITGRGTSTLTVQNGVVVHAPLGSGIVQGNTVESIAYDNADNPGSGEAATSILNYHAALDIKGNTIREGHVGIYNIDAAAEISENTLEIEKVGAYGFGIIASDPPQVVPSPFGQEDTRVEAFGEASSQASPLDVTLSGNVLTFTGADNDETVAIEAKAGYGPDNLNLVVRSNSVTGFGVGIKMWQCESGCHDDPGTFTKLQVSYNRIAGNDIGLSSNVHGLGVDAMNNWWGCNQGPDHDDCDNVAGVGAVDANPWLVLGLEADPSTVMVDGTSTVTADLRFNSSGLDTSSLGQVPDDIAVAFTATLGSVTPVLTGTTSGVATSTFTAGSVAGSALISATLDNETVTTSVAVERVALTLDKTDGITTSRPGDLLTYTLTITNPSGLDATGVVVTDTLPVSTTYIGGGDWQPAGDGATYIYPLGGLAAGQTATLSITARLSEAVPPSLNTITNTAQVADDGTQGLQARALDHDVNQVIVPPDLVITKTNGVTTVVPGQTVTYTLTIANAGERHATGVVVTDTLPSLTDFVTATQPFDHLNGVVTWGPFDLAAGAGTTRTISARLLDAPWPAGVRVITNTAVVADDGTYGRDLDPADNTASDVDVVGVGPDLVIFKDDGEPSALLDEVSFYVISYMNKGNQGAKGVLITETVPAETTFEPGLSTSGWQQVGATDSYTLAVGTLAPNAAGVAVFAVRVNPTLSAGVTAIENLVAIADDGTSGADLNPDNNTDTDVNAVSGAPDLAVEKDDGRTSVGPGDLVTYTLSISNVGTQGATGVDASDTLPAHTTFITASHGGTLSGGFVSWPPFPLPAPGFTTRTVTVQLPATIPAGMDTITNTVSVTDDGANGADLDPSNNSAQDVNSVVATPFLVVTKTDGRDQVTPGETLTYILTVKNVGDQGAAGVVLSDTLPAYTDYVAASGDGAVFDSVVTWPPFDLGVGDSSEHVVTVRVQDPVPATVEAITNTVVAIGPDGVWDSDVDVNVLVQAPALVMTKTDGRDSAEPGDVLTYTITITNPGAQPATGVVVTDTLPGHTQFLSASADYTLDLADGTVAWPAFQLAADEVATRQVVVRVDETLPSGVDSIMNAAIAAGDEGLSASASDVTHLLAAPDLGVSKTDGRTAVGVGDVIVYTLSVENVGTQGATGVVLTDILPSHTTFRTASDGGVADGGVVNWPSFDLTVGAVETRTLTVVIADPWPEGATPVLTNTASVADDGANGEDFDPTNNTDTDISEVWLHRTYLPLVVKQ